MDIILWDVTDPANIKKIDSVKVDARTVNDVKVSKDGKICVISREGASNRKNGMIIIDVSSKRCKNNFRVHKNLKAEFTMYLLTITRICSK